MNNFVLRITPPFTCERSAPKGQGAQPRAGREKGCKRDGYINTRARQVLRLVMRKVQPTLGKRAIAFTVSTL